MGIMRLNLLLALTVINLLFLSSCSSENDVNEKADSGFVMLDVSANSTFSRSVNESDYENVSNYNVRILNSDGIEEFSFIYSEKPEEIKLSNGGYTLEAYMGEEKDASRDGFYVYGKKTFNIQGDAVSVSVDCKPTCAKAVVNFDSEMDTYFSDYYVSYETEALVKNSTTAIWAKGDTEPYYLKVNENGETIKAVIHFVRKEDGKSAEVEKTYNIAPCKSWTLSIAPQNNQGNLGISITVNEATDDEEIDITVPSEWI